MDAEARLLIHPSDQPSPFTSTVTAVDEDWIRLASTEFYPTGGGQPHDTGSMSWTDGRCQVIDVKGRNEVLHNVEGEVPVVGTIVHCSIDTLRRIRLAQMHTAQHLASALAHEVWGAETVGNQIGIETTRIDLKFENRDSFKPSDLIERINDEIRSNHNVRMDHRSLDNLRNDPNVRIRLDRIPNVASLRTIEIEDIDVCPCAGTHVGSTGEIPEVAFDASKSKGAGKLRVSYRFA
ncbi:MAG: Alanine--tRNA ligase [Methanobacteriota archaeon]|nr:MAG: Alanine--tRNA ligase [Euryarchaeota archaeon]